MTERHYSCTLLTDVVINASLATEGNMTSLDYIPGSSILGIVANSIYELKDYDLARKILHSGEVSFGDARIAVDDYPSYAIPFQFYTDKVNKDMTKDSVFLAHFISDKKEVVDGNGSKVQPQQVRSGYFSPVGSTAKLVTVVPKKFSLKSAHNRETRTAQDSQMFGLEAMQAGLKLIFSIRAKNEKHLNLVDEYLLGVKRLGKSKSAEFGQVEMKYWNGHYEPKSEMLISNAVLVYAESHLCFFDERGMPTYQPSAKQLGLSGGKICWEKSQIRTFDYANWNTMRQTSNPTRYCLAKGSVIYVENVSTEQVFGSIGEWQSEGLGRVIYNPFFLQGDAQSAKCYIRFQTAEEVEASNQQEKDENLTDSSNLMIWLTEKNEQQKNHLKVSRDVHRETKNADASGLFKKVTSSQWGRIREYATYAKSKEDLAKSLFENPERKKGNKEGEWKETEGEWKRRKGYLMHGVAYDAVWSRNNEKPIIELQKYFGVKEISRSEQGCEFECHKSLDFIAKFSSEMAKLTIRKKAI